MKLATYSVADQPSRIGLVDTGDAQILDLAAAAHDRGLTGNCFHDMQTLIECGTEALDQARELASGSGTRGDFMLPLQSVKLLAPLPRPVQMRDFSVAPMHLRQSPASFRELVSVLHGKEDTQSKSFADTDIPAVFYEQPIYYKCNRMSVVGHDADIHWPSYSRVIDFELELGLFIGKRGRNIGKAQARNYIFGYSIFNDFSARDAQYLEMRGPLGPCKGKDFDGGNAIGPWIVTADEIPDPHALQMSARVNGELWTQGDMSTVLHRADDIIAYISRDETLYPGEFIGLGTMDNGCGLELRRFLSPGDVIELEVEHIGVLRNRVCAPQDQQASPPHGPGNRSFITRLADR